MAAAGAADAAPPPPPLEHVWYASYGSNLLYERFMCYLKGGRLEGLMKQAPAPPCRDPSAPTGDRLIALRRRRRRQDAGDGAGGGEGAEAAAEGGHDDEHHHHAHHHHHHHGDLPCCMRFASWSDTWRGGVAFLSRAEPVAAATNADAGRVADDEDDEDEGDDGTAVADDAIAGLSWECEGEERGGVELCTLDLRKEGARARVVQLCQSLRRGEHHHHHVALLRAYRVTRQQFMHVVQYENGGVSLREPDFGALCTPFAHHDVVHGGMYGRVLSLGTISGAPILTFTGAWACTPGAVLEKAVQPSEAYLAVIAGGLASAGLDPRDVSWYLGKCAGCAAHDDMPDATRDRIAAEAAAASTTPYTVVDRPSS